MQHVEVEGTGADLVEAFRNDDGLAGDVAGRVATTDLDTARAGEGQLAVVVLSGAGVLGLLDDDDLVAIHLTSHGDRGRQAGVSGRAPLQTFDLRQKLGHVEDLALGDQMVAIHVPQRTSGVAWDVNAVGPGGERHAETGVAGGERLVVEVVVGGHVQSGEIHRDGDDLGLVTAHLAQAAGSSGDVAATGIGDHDSVGLASVTLLHLVTDLGAEGLDARDSVGRVEAGVEVAGVLQGTQQDVEKLRPDRQLDHFGAVGLTGPGLLDDLRLAHVVGVVDLLDDDAGQSALSGLGGDGGTVVSAGGRNQAGKSLDLRLVGAQGCTTSLEAAGRIGGLVLEEDPSSLARSGDLADGLGQTVQLVQRGVTHLGLGLDASDVVEVVTGGGHQGVVVEGQVTALEAVVVQRQGTSHDFAAASHDVVIGVAHDRSSFPWDVMDSCMVPIDNSSGTVWPKLWL